MRQEPPSAEPSETVTDAADNTEQHPRRRRKITGWSVPSRALLAAHEEKGGKLEGWGWWVIGVLALFALAVVSIGLGRYPLGAAKLLSGILAAVIPHAGTHLTSIDVIVLEQIRLPRVLAAIMVGAALSGSGAAYQNMFRNPLVSPDILGVSAGAGFGASLGLFFNMPFAEVQALAFLGGVVSVVLTVGVAQVIGRGSTIVLVLAGIVIGAMAQALISLTQYFANPTTTLPRIVFFLLGSLDNVTWSDNLWVPAVLVAISILMLYALRWPITVLAAGEDEARTLGVNRRVVWSVVIVATTLMTASVVAVAGIVGWVGLVVPHMARYVVGPSFHRLLPASLLIGAFFLLAVDDIGRSAASIEFPLGVLTALIGAPFFIALLAEGPGPVALNIELVGLSFAFGTGEACLNDVSLEVNESELCCLLGPNGAGKTTLLRCLLGLLRPSAGSMRVAGNEVTDLSPRQLARLVAYVPQTTTMVFPFTALEMVVMGRTPFVGVTSSPSRADRRIAAASLDRLGIAHLGARVFSQLSGGERQLTILARALAQEAPVMVLDEPTTGLDYGNEVRLLHVVSELVAGGATVLMTTHQPNHALTWADRAVLLRRGSVLSSGAPAEILTGDQLSSLYEIPILVGNLPRHEGAQVEQLFCTPDLSASEFRPTHH